MIKFIAVIIAIMSFFVFFGSKSLIEISRIHDGDNGTFEYILTLPNASSWGVEGENFDESFVIVVRDYEGIQFGKCKPIDYEYLHIEQIPTKENAIKYKVTVPYTGNWFIYRDGEELSVVVTERTALWKK